MNCDSPRYNLRRCHSTTPFKVAEKPKVRNSGSSHKSAVPRKLTMAADNKSAEDEPAKGSESEGVSERKSEEPLSSKSPPVAVEVVASDGAHNNELEIGGTEKAPEEAKPVDETEKQGSRVHAENSSGERAENQKEESRKSMSGSEHEEYEYELDVSSMQETERGRANWNEEAEEAAYIDYLSGEEKEEGLEEEEVHEEEGEEQDVVIDDQPSSFESEVSECGTSGSESVSSSRSSGGSRSSSYSSQTMSTNSRSSEYEKSEQSDSETSGGEQGSPKGSGREAKMSELTRKSPTQIDHQEEKATKEGPNEVEAGIEHLSSMLGLNISSTDDDQINERPDENGIGGEPTTPVVAVGHIEEGTHQNVNNLNGDSTNFKDNYGASDKNVIFELSQAVADRPHSVTSQDNQMNQSTVTSLNNDTCTANRETDVKAFISPKAMPGTSQAQQGEGSRTTIRKTCRVIKWSKALPIIRTKRTKRKERKKCKENDQSERANYRQEYQGTRERHSSVSDNYVNVTYDLEEEGGKYSEKENNRQTSSYWLHDSSLSIDDACWENNYSSCPSSYRETIDNLTGVPIQETITRHAQTANEGAADAERVSGGNGEYYSSWNPERVLWIQKKKSDYEREDFEEMSKQWVYNELNEVQGNAMWTCDLEKCQEVRLGNVCSSARANTANQMSDQPQINGSHRPAYVHQGTCSDEHTTGYSTCRSEARSASRENTCRSQSSASDFHLLREFVKFLSFRGSLVKLKEEEVMGLFQTYYLNRSEAAGAERDTGFLTHAQCGCCIERWPCDELKEVKSLTHLIVRNYLVPKLREMKPHFPPPCCGRALYEEPSRPIKGALNLEGLGGQVHDWIEREVNRAFLKAGWPN